MNCMKCDRELTGDEVGMHKKMIHRGATEYMCLTCLAAYFQCSEELLHQKMEQFRRMGCTLFLQKNYTKFRISDSKRELKK